MTAQIYIHPVVACSKDMVAAIEANTRMHAVCDNRRVELVSRDTKITMPVIVMQARKEWAKWLS